MRDQYIYIGIVVIPILFFIVWYLYISNRNINQENRFLIKKYKKIKKQSIEQQKLNETKDKLLSIIGHDLRGPLNSLNGMLSLLENSFMSQAEFITLSRDVKKNVNVVYANLENLMMWANAQQKGIMTKPEPVEINRLVHNKIELYLEVAKAKNIKINNETQKDLILKIDKNHLKLILQNLLGNALKFTKNGGEITIGSQINTEEVEIFVRDTGIGMTKEEVNNLFISGLHFSKRGTNSEKGMGLGLMLVKEFVELNDGKLKVISTPGEGSTFIVSLGIQAAITAEQA